MDTITYSTARARLADTMNRVCNDHEPVIITRSGQQAVVMMAMDDYKALEETAYLLRSPRNAQRLLESIVALESGNGKPRGLAE
jgi:antitoxin YefM